MKHNYRLIDAAVQLGLLVEWLITWVINSELLGPLYLITGGWFLISLVIHYIICTQKYEHVYRALCVIMTVLIFVFCLAFIWPVLFFLEVYTLVFLAPVLALAYTVISIAEIRYLGKRPISYLK